MTTIETYRCTRCGAITRVTRDDTEAAPPAAVTCRITDMCMGVALRQVPRQVTAATRGK